MFSGVRGSQRQAIPLKLKCPGGIIRTFPSPLRLSESVLVEKIA